MLLSKPSREGGTQIFIETEIMQRMCRNTSTPVQRITVENAESNLGLEATAESKAEAEKLKNMGNIFMNLEEHYEALANYTKAIQLDNHNVIYYHNRAIVHKKLGNDALAINDYHTALSINPSNNEAYNQLGHIFFDQKEYHEALVNYTKAIQLKDHIATYYWNRANVHKKLGNDALGITDCQTALSINPSSSEAYNVLGNIFFDQKEYHEALANYTKAIQLDNHNIEYYISRASVHEMLKNYALGITDCQTALSINPSNNEAYNQLGHIFFKQKEYHEALVNYTKAIQLDNHNKEYYISRASVHEMLKNYALGITDCQTALSINPSNNEAFNQAIQLKDHIAAYYWNRANVHKKLGNDALAINDYHTALSINPSYSKAYAQLGHVFMKQKKHHEALANYTKAIQLDNHNIKYYISRASVHEMLDNYALGITDCQTALSINPSSSKAYNVLGNIFFDQKEYHEALVNYTKAIQLDDRNAAYYCNRANVHMNFGNDALAIKDCHTALSIDPSHSNAYSSLGLVFRKQEKYHEALANFTKAIQLDNHNIYYYIHRAIVHHKLDNGDLCLEDYLTAFSINPSCRDAHNYLKNLHVLIDQKEYHEALASFTKYIQLNDVVAYHYKGIRLTPYTIPIRTIKDSLTALSIDPSNSEAYTRLDLAFRDLSVRFRIGTKRLKNQIIRSKA